MRCYGCRTNFDIGRGRTRSRATNLAALVAAFFTRTSALFRPFASPITVALAEKTRLGDRCCLTLRFRTDFHIACRRTGCRSANLAALGAAFFTRATTLFRPFARAVAVALAKKTGLGDRCVGRGHRSFALLGCFTLVDVAGRRTGRCSCNLTAFLSTIFACTTALLLSNASIRAFFGTVKTGLGRCHGGQRHQTN